MIFHRNPAIGKLLSYRQLKNRLEKTRARLRPQLPQSVAQLHDFLKDYEPVKGFYQGVIEANDSYGLVFSSTTLLQALAEAHEVFMDGTFAVSDSL